MGTFLIILAVLIIGGFVYFIKVGNDLVKRKNRVDSSWSQIDVQLKRRFDIIPNLVEIVKGYAAHEQDTFSQIANAKSAYMGATSIDDKIEADKQLSSALGRLISITESFPELKANTNFLSLQNELIRIEDKIAFSRQFYNDTVLLYNNAIEVFPGSIIADTKGYKAKNYLVVEDDSKENPQIKF